MATTTSTATSSSSTSGILSSLGIGSGLDISSLVSQLTTAEMSAPNAQVKSEQSAVTTKVSALASFKSALSTFQSSLATMTDASTFNARAATSADDTVVTATATSSAAVGSYDVTVKKLAQAQQLVSTVFSGGSSAVVGTGTLSLSLGNQSFNVSIDSSSNTLAGIRDAINSSSSNPGISATLVYGTTGAQLLLTSSLTGAANTITVNQSDGDGGLSALVYNATTTTNYTVKQAAQDSDIAIAGVDHTSSSNTVGDAIDGITLTLVKAQPDTPVSLQVSNDTSHVTSVLQSFIKAYNTMVGSLTPLGSYDATNQTAGPMLGDSLLAGAQNQISRIMGGVVKSAGSGAYSSLAALGITTQSDGTLSLNTAKLTTAMNSNFTAVADVMGASDGVVNQLNKFLTDEMASGGAIDARNTTLSNQQKAITNEQDLITARTATVQARYLAQFNAMDSLLAQLNNTSTYLTEQFKALDKSSN